MDYLDFAAPAGFDTVIIGEHHFSDFIVSVPQAFLTWVAGRHPNIGLASGVTLLPHHDPVRIAEDFATVDVISGGRAELWVGKGVEPHVYRQFGQDASKLVEMQYVACSSIESALTAAELGLGVTITMLAIERTQLRGIVDAHQQRFAEVGHQVEPRVTINCHVHVAPTSQDAYDHLGVYQFPFQKWVFGKRLGREPDEVQLPPRITELGDPDSAIVCGSPQEVVDRIGRLRATCAFDRFTYQGDYGGQPWPLVKRSLELFATEVIPQLADPH